MRESGARTERAARMDGKTEEGVEGDSSEGDDHSDPRERREFRAKVSLAPHDLLGRWLVVWRRTPDGRCDEGVGERQTIGRVARRRLTGESDAVQRGHQKVTRSTRAVAREEPARSVRSVGGRSQPHDHEPCGRVPEPGDRACPVGVVQICTALLSADPLAVVPQARTCVAGHNPLVDDGKTRLGQSDVSLP